MNHKTIKMELTKSRPLTDFGFGLDVYKRDNIPISNPSPLIYNSCIGIINKTNYRGLIITLV